jgi:hypothetical protein
MERGKRFLERGIGYIRETKPLFNSPYKNS